MSEPHPFDRLRLLCARLRAPDGCPWDREQSLASLRTYIVEEAYEVVDAITAEDSRALAEELGDLLFQIVFVAQLAEEQGWFDVLQVCQLVHAKMVARHPHVFGDLKVENAAQVVQNWERLKRREAKGGALSGVPESLPALLKTLRITEKAAALGFDWERPQDVLAKVREEVSELERVVGRAQREHDAALIREELGDVLFSIANVARHLGVDPEAALQAANQKFLQRFSTMEQLAAARGIAWDTCSPEDWEALWQEAKTLVDRKV
ncbi:MAG: nucleoside triphosphate pyrophosphohydrolase [Thermoanaerobaculum sp.]|nr:nucleoside triphosphate pyrophosphohydrolase [Thermoanaerobaculum sp.]